MQFQVLFAATLLFTPALGYAVPTHCPAGETQMCCQNLLPENNVGYYCAGPNQPFPCQSGSLKAMCCKSYDLTPRGVSRRCSIGRRISTANFMQYTGSNCTLRTA